MQLSATKGSLEFYARCERERKPWESLPDTARRLMIADALCAFDQNQTKAGELLLMSQQSVQAQLSRERAKEIEYQLGNKKLSRKVERRNATGRSTLSQAIALSCIQEVTP